MSCGVPIPSRALKQARRPAVEPDRLASYVATGSASRSSSRAKAAHICVGGAGWVLLGLLWLWQSASRDIPGDWATVVSAAGGAWLALAALSVVWVRWNQGIYRRRHNRRTPLVTEVQFERDAVGRRIAAPPDGLDGSQIVITIDGPAAVKRYLAG